LTYVWLPSVEDKINLSKIFGGLSGPLPACPKAAAQKGLKPSLDFLDRNMMSHQDNGSHSHHQTHQPQVIIVGYRLPSNLAVVVDAFTSSVAICPYRICFPNDLVLSGENATDLTLSRSHQTPTDYLVTDRV
jgi:hypothetical protein